MTRVAYAALWVFVFSVPWENIILIPGVGTIGRLTGMVALGFAVLAAVIQARMRPSQPFHVAARALCGLGRHRRARARRTRAGAIGKFGTYLSAAAGVVDDLGAGAEVQAASGLFLAYVLGAYVAMHQYRHGLPGRAGVDQQAVRRRGVRSQRSRDDAGAGAYRWHGISA